MVNKKKIFDITPPSAKAKEFLRLPKSTEVKEPLVKNPLAVKKLRPILIIAGLLLVGIFSFVFIKTKAEIEVWPVKEQAQFKTQLAQAGKLTRQSQSVSQEFASTGKTIKAEKAQGLIRVYNNYHLDQILMANTRFWCFEKDELKEFKTKQKIVIPSQGQLDVVVIASSAGEEYNINPCTFSIPGLKGGPRYTVVYGKSSSPMTGGARIEMTQVSQEDLDIAKETITEKALAEAKAALKNSISSTEYILVDEAIETKIIEVNPLTEVGKNVDNFIFQAKAEAKALVFKKAELEEFARAYLLSQLPQGKELVEGSLVAGYSPETVNLAKGEIVLNLEISAEIYHTLNEKAVKESVKNLRPSELMLTIRKFPAIARVEIKLWPFWAKTIPQDETMIKIKLNLD